LRNLHQRGGGSRSNEVSPGRRSGTPCRKKRGVPTAKADT